MNHHTGTMRALRPAWLAMAALSILVAGCSLNLPEPRKFALVYGINFYPAGFDLSYPVADATDVAAMLEANGFAPGDVTLRVEGAATKANLAIDISTVADSMGPDDLFLFYYSGHGGQFTYNGEDREWIFPSGSLSSAPATYGDILPANSIYDSELAQMLSGIPTARKVIILDSCNSGGFIGSGLTVDRVEPHYTGSTPALVTQIIPEAVANYRAFTTGDISGLAIADATVLAASGSGEFSWEDSLYGHGVLTYYLLKTPTQADLNGDGSVTVLEAFALVKAGIDASWNEYFLSLGDDSTTFSPRISGGPVDLVLF